MIETIVKAAEPALPTTTEPTIPIAEIFGPTIMGEGAKAGIPTYFVRVGGCDFKCGWCDSGHAVLVEEVRRLPRLTQDQIIENLFALARKKPGPRWLSISGGNPGLYDLTKVVYAWHIFNDPTFVNVETQGSKWQPWFGDVALLTVSPKPPSSGMKNEGLDAFMVQVGEVEEYWGARYFGLYDVPRDRWQMVFKVVVFDENDYQFARDLHGRWPLIPFYLSCGTAMGGLSGKWVPPQYGGALMTFGHIVDSKEVLLARYRWLAERAMNDPAMADVVVLPQLHALTWGITTRGV